MATVDGRSVVGTFFFADAVENASPVVVVGREGRMHGIGGTTFTSRGSCRSLSRDVSFKAVKTT